MIVNDLLQESSKELLKVIVHVCLACTQNMIKGSSLLFKSKSRWESLVDMRCNWSALDPLTKLIKFGTTSLSVMNIEIDALLKTNSRKYSSNFTTDSQISIFPIGTCLADLEKRHILALAFWNVLK